MEAEEAEKVILRWDSTASEDAQEEMIFQGDRKEVNLYLQAVDEIQRALAAAASSSSLLQEEEKEKWDKTIQIAMARLEDEFRNIVFSHTNPVDVDSLTLSSSFSSTASNNDNLEQPPPPPPQEAEAESLILRADSSTSSSYREVELIPAEAISDLSSIAKRMVSSGYLKECFQVYSNSRKPSLDSSFKKLGIERLSIGDIQRMDWVALESKIRRWIRSAKLAIRVVFGSEKRLCQSIFQDDVTGDACFFETVKGHVSTLFNFAEAISISRRSPEKLFKILDLHDCLMDLMPDVDTVFDSKTGESVRVQAAEILTRLGEAARGILSEFESAVLKEPSVVPVPGGTIHPLTRYVMNYISLISDYKQTLVQLIMSKPSTGSRYSGDLSLPNMEFLEFQGKSPLELHLIWIIVILQFNLEGKSKHYRDGGSLEHFFMMNNVRYIVQKVRGSPELAVMVGNNYLKKLTAKVRRSATSYERATWVRVLYCLRDEGLHLSGGFSSGVSKSVLRERFKAFNAMFEEVHGTQATWFIPDAQLREELRISISEKLIPAYRNFLGRFRSHIESGRHPENYIKYSVEDLEGALLDFFEGHPVSQHPRRRSH